MQSPGQIGVESIFDGIVCPPHEFLGDIAPPVTVNEIQLDDFNIFFKCPLGFANIWVKLIEPAFSTLLSYATWQIHRDFRPVPCPVLLD